jgi:hypothetical protein
MKLVDRDEGDRCNRLLPTKKRAIVKRNITMYPGCVIVNTDSRRSINARILKEGLNAAKDKIGVERENDKY